MSSGFRRGNWTSGDLVLPEVTRPAGCRAWPYTVPVEVEKTGGGGTGGASPKMRQGSKWWPRRREPRPAGLDTWVDGICQQQLSSYVSSLSPGGAPGSTNGFWNSPAVPSVNSYSSF